MDEEWVRSRLTKIKKSRKDSCSACTVHTPGGYTLGRLQREATPVALLRQATSAARINDARVLTTASGREKSIHQWEELRMFDPGD